MAAMAHARRVVTPGAPVMASPSTPSPAGQVVSMDVGTLKELFAMVDSSSKIVADRLGLMVDMMGDLRELAADAAKKRAIAEVTNCCTRLQWRQHPC